MNFYIPTNNADGIPVHADDEISRMYLIVTQPADGTAEILNKNLTILHRVRLATLEDLKALIPAHSLTRPVRKTRKHPHLDHPAVYYTSMKAAGPAPHTLRPLDTGIEPVFEIYLRVQRPVCQLVVGAHGYNFAQWYTAETAAWGVYWALLKEPILTPSILQLHGLVWNS